MSYNKLRLSYSAVNTYKSCGYKYYLEKIKKLKPTWVNSSLLFGSAIDEAMETILAKRDDYYDTFEKVMDSFEVFGRKTELSNVRYTSGDLQIDVLPDDFQEVLDSFCKDNGIEVDCDYEELFQSLVSVRKSKKAFNKDEQLVYNFIGHSCLKEKGKLLLPKLKEWFEEYVDEVIEVQKKIELENEYGDRFVGYLDFIVKNKKGETVLIDLKTSSDPNKYYPEDCVKDSDQLAIYYEESDVDKAAYLVVDKKIRKRDPRVRLKYVEGLITEEKLDRVFEDIEEQTAKIKNGDFNKNKDSCFQFGKCPYYDYCHKNKKMTGLAYDK